MIKKIDDISEFTDYKQKDIYSIRIMSLLDAYGTGYDFAVFYKQTDENNNITSIISKLDGDYTLSSCEDADFEELKDFFLTLGYNSVLSDGRFYINDNFDWGTVMSAVNKTELHRSYTTLDCYPKLMDLFNIEDYDRADFESWYVDLSHRIRHGCSRAYALNANGEMVSSGIFSSILGEDAILSSVRTVPQFRNLGYGSVLVSEMMCDIKGIVYLMREKNKNENFYSKLGFKNIGTWRMFK